MENAPRLYDALACGSFKSASYIEVIDWVAELTSRTLRDTGRMTVVVQDNGSLPG